MSYFWYLSHFWSSLKDWIHRIIGKQWWNSFLFKETPETHFVRNTTGRGSINKGPAPTRSSVLRQQKIDAAKLAEARSRTPNQGCPLHNPGAPMTPTLRRRAPSPSGSLYGSLPHKSSMRNQPSPASSLYGTLPHKRDSIGSNQSNDYSFKALVKPSVVRPSRWVFQSKRLSDSCRNVPFDKSIIVLSKVEKF